MDLTKYQAQWVPISQINTENRTFQFRKDITPESVAPLAKSMADKEVGQKFPIVLWLRLTGERVVVAGLRRLTAAISLKWESILAITIPEAEASYDEVLKLNFIENVERKTLNSLDIMFACKKLKDLDKKNTNEYIGKMIGKSENQVRRYIKVAEAPADAQQKLASGDTSIRGVSGEQIASRGDSEINSKNYIVKSTNKGIDAKIKMGAIPDNEAALDAFITELKKAWKQALKKSQKSKIRPSGGKSKIKSNSSPLEGEEAQRAGEGGVVKPTQEHPISNGSKPETVEDVIAQANKQQIEMLNAFKERIKTPEGRPIVEAIAKANGCQTPEDYIAKMEEALKNKGLL